MTDLAAPGLGLPLRIGMLPHLYSLQSKGQLAFCEVTLEQLVMPHAAVLDALDTLVNCGVEIRLHSLGLLPGCDCTAQRLALADLAGMCSPTLLSIHLAMGRGIGVHGESFVRPRYDGDFEREFIFFLEHLRTLTKIPLAIENIAAYEEVEDSPSGEVAFLGRVAAAAKVAVVFDVSNHFTTYGDAAPTAALVGQLARIPIAHLHLSGGRWLDGRYIDTHCDSVPASHLAFARRLRSLCAAPALYERDGRFDADEVGQEIRALLGLSALTVGEPG